MPELNNYIDSLALCRGLPYIKYKEQPLNQSYYTELKYFMRTSHVTCQKKLITGEIKKWPIG